MIQINCYDDKTIIDNNIQSIEIKELVYPLNNLPTSLENIHIIGQIGIFNREHKIPEGCKITIENIIIPELRTLNRLQEEDYQEITYVSLGYRIINK